MQAFFNRLKEPSSWAGAAALLGLFGVKVSPDLFETGVQAITGVAALAAILIPEKR